MSSTRVAKGLNANLENFELTDVMQLITQQVKCGVLSVEGSNGSCSWSFNEGSLVSFDCNFPGHILDLKNILRQSGTLDDKRLVRLHESDDLSSAQALGKALVKNNICTREELEKMNLRRLIESFIITLQWTKGRYKFIPTSEINNHAFLAPQDANFIILEALRQIDEMAVMKKRLQPLDQVYESTLTLANDETINDADTLFQEGLHDQFDDDEFEVYKLFDGQRSLQNVLENSITGQFHTCRTMLNFIERGIIAPLSEEMGFQFTRSQESSQNRYWSGLSLLILSGALLIATGTALQSANRTGPGSHPTLFSAIINNIKADQNTMQKQAQQLLLQTNSHTDIDEGRDNDASEL
ncbi:MAG: hypothetical protein DRH03_09350 [Deltaproteobacteria bacterium]|nr:MAG: hypothetical protein DRH03_09350 [Deltaproteobacteria bacterium]